MIKVLILDHKLRIKSKTLCTYQRSTNKEFQKSTFRQMKHPEEEASHQIKKLDFTTTWLQIQDLYLKRGNITTALIKTKL